jgi:hypothetical protein
MNEQNLTPSNYHPEWQQSRIDVILSRYPKDFFKGKTILELGAFNGYIGAYFQSLGATVHCVEGRLENVNQIKTNYPNCSAECANLDTPIWRWGKWDIIINFGLYYHLEKHHEQHLINCINNCDVMFFETVVYDSFDKEIYFRHEEKPLRLKYTDGKEFYGNWWEINNKFYPTPHVSEIELIPIPSVDQSLSLVGGTPSTSYVENIFQNNNSKYLRISDNMLSKFGYDWFESNSKQYHDFFRRFWIVTK